MFALFTLKLLAYFSSGILDFKEAWRINLIPVCYDDLYWTTRAEL